MRDEGVTHYCAAPIVHTATVNAPAAWREGLRGPVRGMVASAPPPAAVLAQMEAMGFDLTHVYGLTEVYGPAAVCAEQDSWTALSQEERAVMKARRGVRYHLQSQVAVLDPDTMEPVPADGETIGEIMFRGNICMKGYLKMRRPRAKPSPAAGSTPATGRACLTATSRSRTAARTSSSPAARTSPRSRSKTRCTAIPRCWRRRWSPSPTPSGARRHAPSSS